MHTLMRKYAIWLAIFAALAGCAKGAPQAEKIILSAKDGVIDLASSLPGKWDRVCVLTPYTSNSDAKATLGVSVDITGSSRINVLDNISLLVTMHEKNVVALYEIPVNNIFFAALGSGCYERNDSIFLVSETGSVTHKAHD